MANSIELISIIILLIIYVPPNYSKHSCLGIIGEEVDWWFMFTKQSTDPIGGGYFYASSNGFSVDVEEDGEELAIKYKTWGSLDKEKVDGNIYAPKYIIEQHTDKVFESNKNVYKKCTLKGNLVRSTLPQDCLQAIQKDGFIAEAWYQDQIPQEGDTAPHPKGNKRKRKSGDSDDGNDSDFGTMKPDWAKGTYTPTSAHLKSKTAIPRTAHSKFLISVDTITGDGYIIDHSANIPSFFADRPKFTHKPLLFSDKQKYQDDTKKLFGTKNKFDHSHHFFCFNFDKTNFGDLMELIKDIKPKETITNYRDEQDHTLFNNKFMNNKYDIHSLLEPDTNIDNTCDDFYYNMYRGLRDKKSKDAIMSHLLSNVNVKILSAKKCIKWKKVGSVFVMGLRSRAQPNGVILDSEVNQYAKFMPDDIKMTYRHLTMMNYGIDPYTLLAKEFTGDFFVSTLPQSQRGTTPSIKTPSFSIVVVKTWEFDKKEYSKRHEKLLFPHKENLSNRVCVGDGNRNFAHTLYGGLTICFQSDAVKKYLNSAIKYVQTAGMFSDPPTKYNPAKNEFIDKGKTDEDKAYPPTLVQLIQGDGQFTIPTQLKKKIEDYDSDEDQYKKKTPQKKKVVKGGPTKKEPGPPTKKQKIIHEIVMVEDN